MIIFNNLDANHDKELHQTELNWVIDSISFVDKWTNKKIQKHIAELIADADEDYDGIYAIKETEKSFLGLINEVNEHSGAC